jgi:hypothetical protein
VRNAIKQLLYFITTCLLLALTACATPTPPLTRIALLAPFEGRYREVGYNAYYAALLALNDPRATHTELLAVDDGGTPATAAERAAALARDPLVKGIIALGYDAADPTAQNAAGDLPLLIVGHWNARPATDHTFILSSADLDSTLTTPPNLALTDTTNLQGTIIGGDVFALEGFRRLASDWRNVLIASSAAPPEQAFRDRYAQLGQFVPQPGLLATLTFDATHLMLNAAQSPDPATDLATTTYDGINGSIRFEDGYWTEAPIHTYRYEPECGAPGNEVCFIRVEER